MAETSKIEWTDATWNVITGCSVLTPGCTNCYAMRLAGTRLQHHPSRAGLTRDTKAGPVWTGDVRFNEGWLDQPLKWKRPRDIFAIAHGDLFHPNMPDAWIDRVFAVMALAPHHRFQVLTKRIERAADYIADPEVYRRVLYAAHPIRDKRPQLTGIPISSPQHGAFWPHVLIGTSVERQKEADERRPHLQQIAELGWKTWASYEPALGSVDWCGYEFIKWLVSGGESGPGARPSHPDWHRSARDWCAAHVVPYHFKQWGNWAPFSNFDGHIPSGLSNDFGGCAQIDEVWHVGKKAAGRHLDGRTHDGVPGR